MCVYTFWPDPVSTDRLQNTSFDWSGNQPRDPRSFSIDLGETISGHVKTVGSVTANADHYTITGSGEVASYRNGFGTRFRYGGDSDSSPVGADGSPSRVSAQATIEVTAGSGGDGIGLVLWPNEKGWSELSPRITDPNGGGAFVYVTAGGNVKAQIVNTDGSWGNEETLSLTQGTTGVKYDVRLTYDYDTDQMQVLVDGNGERNVLTKTAPDFSHPLRAGCMDFVEGDGNVYSFSVSATPRLPRFLSPSPGASPHIALGEEDVFDAPQDTVAMPKEVAPIFIDGTFYVACCA